MDFKQSILTEGDLHILQAQIIEGDHAHEDQTQRKHLHQLLTLKLHNGKIIEDRLRAIVACDLSKVAQNNADNAGQEALKPTMRNIRIYKSALGA